MAIDHRILQGIGIRDNANVLNMFNNALLTQQNRKIVSAQEARRAELHPLALQQAQANINLTQGKSNVEEEKLFQMPVSRGGSSVRPLTAQEELIQQQQQSEQIAQGYATSLKASLDSGDVGAVEQQLLKNKARLAELGMSTTGVDEDLAQIQSSEGLLALRQEVNSTLSGSIRKSAGQSEFENLLSLAQDPNSTKLERDSANRALGNLAKVGSLTGLERLGGDKVLTTAVAGSQAEIEGAKETAKELAKINPALAKLTQTQNIKRIAELKTTERSRASTTNKARRFLKSFKASAQSGASRSALSFLPGVFTDQAQFDEQFNAFAEVAAREKLKAAGETRPTDADVEGMKRAIFGVGRDEVTNINLLEEFIADQSDLDIELDELRDAKRLGVLTIFTGLPISAENSGVPETDLTNLSLEELIAERNRLGGQ